VQFVTVLYSKTILNFNVNIISTNNALKNGKHIRKTAHYAELISKKITILKKNLTIKYIFELKT
jgi:hypothetical protein